MPVSSGIAVKSSYVENIRAECIKQFNDEMALHEFRKRFKSQIEDGLTLEKAIAMFEKVQEEVFFEEKQEQVFLAIFAGKEK